MIHRLLEPPEHNFCPSNASSSPPDHYSSQPGAFQTSFCRMLGSCNSICFVAALYAGVPVTLWPAQAPSPFVSMAATRSGHAYKTWSGTVSCRSSLRPCTVKNAEFALSPFKPQADGQNGLGGMREAITIINLRV